jgi:hypothetical protein
MSGAFGRCVLGRCVLRLDSGLLHGVTTELPPAERAALDDRLLQVIPLLEVMLDELEAQGHAFATPRGPFFHNRCVAYEFAPLVERVQLELLAEPPLPQAAGEALVARVGTALTKTVPRVAPRLPPPPTSQAVKPWWRRLLARVPRLGG